MKSIQGLADNDKLTGEEPKAVPNKLRRWGPGGWQLWLGVVFSLFFLILALRNINYLETADALRKVKVLILCLAVGSYILSILAKAARWQLLLAVHKAPSFGRAISIYSIGQMVNAFFPAHLGEYARANLMGEAESDSKVFVLGTVAVEKIADLLFLLISITLLLSQMILPNWLVSPARGSALVMLILVPIFVLLAGQRNLVLRLAEWAIHFVPVRWRGWLLRQVQNGLSSLDSVRRPGMLAGLIVLSFIVCFLSALTNYLVFLALGLPLSPITALLLLVVLQVGTEIPSSPGGIGVFQYLIILTLSFFAVDKNVALGYSVLLYLVIYLPIAIIGVYCLWREKITWKKLDDAAAMLKRIKKKPI